MRKYSDNRLPKSIGTFCAARLEQSKGFYAFRCFLSVYVESDVRLLFYSLPVLWGGGLVLLWEACNHFDFRCHCGINQHTAGKVMAEVDGCGFVCKAYRFVRLFFNNTPFRVRSARLSKLQQLLLPFLHPAVQQSCQFQVLHIIR